MQGIASRQKRYVEVVSRMDVKGQVSPLQVIWSDGRRFSVEKVLDARRAQSLKTGGTGVRYTVQVDSQATYLWYEEPRWFVEAKVAAMP